LLGDDAVAEEVEAFGLLGFVQFGGSPIIHSTNNGDRCVSPLPSFAGVGVAISVGVNVRLRFLSISWIKSAVLIASVSDPILPRSLMPTAPRFASVDCGVGNIPLRAIVVRLSLPALGLSFAPPTPLIPFWLDPYSDAVGVGSEQEETISEVRGADGCRGNAIPFRSPPARCQVTEDALERLPLVDREQPGHVLDEQHRRSTLARNAPDLGPEPAGIIDAESLTGDACTLTRESSNDEIHATAPRSAIEGFQIVPDRT
jgi:hypothetical protein